jgi:UPF0716 family protein affecting phage T7 exclusion
MRTLSRAAGAVATSILGAILVAAGIVMLVTPGPGLLSIAAGLALLARTFPWARRLLDRARQAVHARLDHRSAQRVERLQPPSAQTTPSSAADQTTPMAGRDVA